MAQNNIRMATLEDAQRILDIYNPYIENTCITLEYDCLSLEDFQNRMASIMKNFPWIVYEQDGIIIGYAYTSAFHTRAGYAWDCDCSIYLDSTYHGNGIGTALYLTLFDIMKAMGYYNLYALVTSQNPASLRFHESLGFIIEAQQENIAFKFGKWQGITRMVKRIGDFSKAPTAIQSYKNLSLQDALSKYV